MKKSFWFLTILFLTTLTIGLISSCKPSGRETEKDLDLTENYDVFQSYNLATFDIPANIMLPDNTANIGASTKPEVLHKDGGFKWDVTVGPNFTLHIEDWGANKDLVTDKKKQLKDLEIFDINYLVDEPNFIIYELKLKVSGSANAQKNVGIPHTAYHVFAEKVIDGITYEFRSPDDGYEKMIIELMAKTIRSLKPLAK
jgi:hypothetical protein